MQYIYNELSADEILNIQDDSFTHIFKARRTRVGERLSFRNLKDSNLYIYEVVSISKKSAQCVLVEIKEHSNKEQKEFFLAWCVVDPKTIEKTLPTLNEMGVSKIYFIYSDFSQKNFKIDFQKLSKILIYSSQQCGRDNLMELEIFSSLDHFIKSVQEFGVVDFSPNRLENIKSNVPKTWLVGPEGGFSQNEKKILQNYITIGFNTNNILKSESAVVAITSKIIL